MERVVLACMALLVSGGCDRSAADASGRDAPTATVRIPPAAEAATRAPAPVEPLDETDRLMLAEARTACQESDYRALFDTMIHSRAVRLAYSAPKVRVTFWSAQRPLVSQAVPKSDYDQFPIVFEDYYRKPATTLGGIGPGEHVILSFSQASDESVVVDWIRVTYDGRTEGGDDLGQAHLLDGRPYEDGLAPDGRLLLRATADCWEIAADERFVRD